MNGQPQKTTDSTLEIVRLAPPSIHSFEVIKRPVGYQLPDQMNIRAAGFCGTILVEGFGSGDEPTARAKATSEFFERYTRLLVGGGTFNTSTSNGWAAHINSENAIAAATFELVERDTALRTWFDGGPYYEIPLALWPQSLSLWSLSAEGIEFFRARVFLTLGPHGGCISVVLFNKAGASLAAHASGSDLESAISSAFSEVLRSAHAVLRLDSFNEVLRLHQGVGSFEYGPGANSLAYAYGASLPDLDFVETSKTEVKRLWSIHLERAADLTKQAKVALYEIGDRVVANVFCPNVMQVFWGPTPEKMKVKNKRPHFVG